MPTQAEELQAKEFLKRAEIRTMKKDLMALRETDALRERDKIVKLKTLEEQLTERQKANELAGAKKVVEKIGRDEVLTKNEGQERVAEKDLKNYATEQERQQIFLLESQRLGFEKQIDDIDKVKDPALKLEKNNLLLQKRTQQEKLNAILAEEKKFEDEQKFIVEKEKTTTIPEERKGLEQSRWDLDEKIKEVEKRRWVAEKDIQETTAKVTEIDKSSENMVLEKNGLREKVLGADKSLREIYSVIMAREEEKRKGLAAEQVAKREALAKVRAAENEKMQRQQWKNTPIAVPRKTASLTMPVPTKKPVKSFADEEEARKKFLQDVDKGVQSGGGQKQSNIK